MYVSIPSLFSETPEKGLRSHSKWLWANKWLLGIELRTSGRTVSVLMPCSPVESAWQAEAWKLLMRQKSFTETRSWSLVFSLTHTLIFHSCISLVYGSTCSLLVLSYKCLLRLNSDIVKAFRQCSNSPSSSLARPWVWNSVLPLVLHYLFE